MVKSWFAQKFNIKKSEHFFIKNAVMFASFFLVLILFFGIVLCNSIIKDTDTKIIESANNNVSYIKNISEEIFARVNDQIKYIASNKDIELLMYKSIDEEFYYNENVKIAEYLKNSTSLNEYISSIYIYSKFREFIITSTGSLPLNYFKDTTWIEQYDKLEKNSTYAYFRKNKYTGVDVLSFIFRAENSDKKDGGVIIDIDINRHMLYDKSTYMTLLVEKGTNNILYKNKFYSNDSEIQKILLNETGILHIDGKYYALAKQSSKYADFDYVVIEKLPNYGKKITDIYIKIVTIFLILIIIFCIIALYLSKVAYKPIIEISQIMKSPNSKKAKEYLESDVTTKEIADKILFVVSNNEKLQTELNTRMETFNFAQLKALQWQINPHFIFNTLNTLYFMADEAMGSDGNVTKGLMSLSKLMRYCLKTDPMIVTLLEEIENTKEFIKIMQARLENEFTVLWEVENQYLQRKVVKMCLQPVIENSFQYGMKNIKHQGSLKVRAFDTDEHFIVEISDNGSGMDEENLNNLRKCLVKDVEISDVHIGLTNVNGRIILMFGEKCGMTINSEIGKGTTVTMKFPLD